MLLFTCSFYIVPNGAIQEYRMAKCYVKHFLRLSPIA